MPRKPISFVLSVNDLEAATIVAFARHFDENNIAIVDLELEWGEVLSPFDQKLDPDKLGSHIFLIEYPNPVLEERLRHAGKQVTIIDHHTFTLADGKIIDRRNRLSSLDQICSIMNWSLNEAQHEKRALVSANDCGSWFAIMRQLAYVPYRSAVKKAQDTRDDEQAIRQKYRSDNSNTLPFDWGFWSAGRADESGVPQSYRVRLLDSGMTGNPGREFHLISGPSSHMEYAGEAYTRHLAIGAHRSFLKDKLSEKDQNKKRICKRGDRQEWLVQSFGIRQNIQAPEILRLATSPDPVTGKAQLSGLFFSCGRESTMLIDEIIDVFDANSDAELSLYSGGNGDNAYLGAHGNPQKLSKLADRIIDNACHGNKPLRRWQTTFFQALELKQDTVPVFPDVKDSPPTIFELTPETRNYLWPAIQPVLAPTIDQQEKALEKTDVGSPDAIRPILSWKIELPQGTSVVVQNDRDRVLAREPLQRILVHFCYGNLIFLEWSFKSAEDCAPQNGQPLWHFLIDQKMQFPPKSKINTVAQLLQFNYAARMCFSPYKTDSYFKTTLIV